MQKPIEYLLFFVLLFSNSIYGQENENNFEAKIGYGLYQGYNVGLSCFYAEKLKIGFGIGNHLNSPELDFNYHLEHTLYFGHLNKQNLGKWYFDQQLIYWEIKGNSAKYKILTAGLNIGRSISITKRLGLDLEIGPTFNWVFDIERDPLSEDYRWILPILGNGSVHLTYKF